MIWGVPPWLRNQHFFGSAVPSQASKTGELAQFLEMPLKIGIYSGDIVGRFEMVSPIIYTILYNYILYIYTHIYIHTYYIYIIPWRTPPCVCRGRRIHSYTWFLSLAKNSEHGGWGPNKFRHFWKTTRWFHPWSLGSRPWQVLLRQGIALQWGNPMGNALFSWRF